MNQETVGYDAFFLKPVEVRIKIFNEISAENIAALFKTQAERWLATNRSIITQEQFALVEKVIQSISPEWYKKRSDFDEIEPEAEDLVNKLETIFSRDDLRDFATERAKYILAVEDKSS